MLQHPARGPFIAAVLADLPGRPPYFARMKRVNQDGPDLLGLATGTRRLPRSGPPRGLAADGAILVDLRPAGAFATAHPDGAINLGHGNKVGYWAGWVLPPDVPLLVADEAAHAQDGLAQLVGGITHCPE
jgi:hydroxyacylglutathione hydrolase